MSTCMLTLLSDPATLCREFQACAPAMNGTWAGCDTHVSWCDATVLPLVDRPERSRRPETYLDDPAVNVLLRVLPAGARR